MSESEKPTKVPGWQMAIAVGLLIGAGSVAGGAVIGEKQLEVRVEQLERDHQAMQIADIPARLAKIETRLDSITPRLDHIDVKLDAIDLSTKRGR
jgi:hypothetical protein